MREKREKWIIAVICALGILSVGYGMTRDQDIIFIIGLFFVVVGYLLLRRKLKETARNLEEKSGFSVSKHKIP